MEKKSCSSEAISAKLIEIFEMNETVTARYIGTYLKILLIVL